MFDSAEPVVGSNPSQSIQGALHPCSKSLQVSIFRVCWILETDPLFFILFFLKTWVLVYMCVHSYVMYVCEFERAISDVIFRMLFTYFETGRLTGLELTSWPSEPQDPAFLCLLKFGIASVQHNAKFSHGLWDRNQGTQALCWLNHIPNPLMLLFFLLIG